MYTETDQRKLITSLYHKYYNNITCYWYITLVLAGCTVVLVVGSSSSEYVKLP